MCVIEIGALKLMDAGLTSVLTDNLSPELRECFEMIVNSSIALYSLPALELPQPILELPQPILELPQPMQEVTEELAPLVTPFVLNAISFFGIIGVLWFQYEHIV